MSAAKKTREYLTPEEFQLEICDWSRKTLERKIKNEGFPFVKDGNRTLIPVTKAREWFKKREGIS
jgi:hypothetical protein